MVKHIDTASLLKEIYNSTYDYGIFTTDLDAVITTWNAGAERIIGFSAEEAIGQEANIIFTPEDKARNEVVQEMQIARAKGRAEDYRWHLRKDGSRFWADGVLTIIRDGHGQHAGYLKIFRDITDRKIAEAEIHRAANCDILTGLANRYSFEVTATEFIALATRGDQQMALHLIDLDHFKQVNDTLGHHTGDLLLQQAAQRMRQALRESDFIARLGGDEFVVLQPNMDSPQAAAELAGKLIRELAHPFTLDGREVLTSGSIGIALCPQDANDMDQLLKKADLAMYRAKADGPGKFHYFTEKMDALAHQKSRDLAALRDAFEKHEFWLEYQPKIAFADGQVMGMEALLRCSNQTLRDHAIDNVIDLAIESGLMKKISYWVLHEACSQLRRWKDSGLPVFRMAVNVCVLDLTDPDFPGIIDAVLAETGLRPHDLELEMTERGALEVENRGVMILNALRSRGIDVTLDDFGTGYSALSYLRNLPVTIVKLDKSFLIDIPHDTQGSAIVKAVIDLSRGLGLQVIAEGVETEAQATLLKDYNCTGLQGFLITKPLPAAAMTAWLAAGNGTAH